MKLSAPPPPDCLPIAAVERDTGLLKDTLRVWEKRYGFPQPLRDAHGERIYPREQIERLRQIRRLMDQGHRPGKLFAASETELASLLTQDEAPGELPEGGAELLDILRARKAEALLATLQQHWQTRGAEDFVLNFATPLSIAIGKAWARGELDIAQEHLYTEQMQTVLRNALSQAPGTSAPHILLTTFPDELHSLGLLFAQTLLSNRGAQCTSLGIQTPLEDIRKTAQEGGFDVIVLAFSAAFPPRAAFSGLSTLAASLPPGIEIWVGARHLAEKPISIPGLRYLSSMSDTLSALQEWRQNHPA